MNIIIAVMRAVVRSVSTTSDVVSRRPIAQTISAPRLPMAAASVGAAMPAMIDPSTAITSPTGGAITLNSLTSSWRVEVSARSSAGTAGTISGFTMPRIRM